MITHKCNKEAEIATMAEKLNNIEKKVDQIDVKLDGFISSADNKYATKEELKNVKASLDKNENRLWKITEKVAAIGAAIYIILKLNGYA